jgi:hypothetical protein
MAVLRFPEGDSADFSQGGIYFIGNATTLIRFGGITILTDPAFMQPSSCPGYPSPEPARSSRGTTNAVSWACCDLSPCQGPVNSSTAIAAVGNLNRTRSSASASPARALASDSASSCMAGSCPTISRVCARGAISRARSNSSLAAAPYTRWSKLTLGEVSSSAAASCHVSRARLAVEQMTRSGARPAARSHRPATGHHGGRGAPTAAHGRRHQAKLTWRAAAAPTAAQRYWP